MHDGSGLRPWKEGGFELIAAPIFGEGDTSETLKPFRDQLSDESACRFLDYWARLVSAHGLAIKRRFDPLEIYDLLPYVFLEEWDSRVAQSRVRLEGSMLESFWGGGVVGQSIDDQVQGPINALWKEADRLNFEEHRGILAIYHLDFRNRDYRWIADVTLPMIDDKGGRFTIGYMWKIPPRRPPSRPDRV